MVNNIRHIELIRHRNQALLQLKKNPRRYSPSVSRITSNSSACGEGGERGAEYAITSKAVNLSQSASGGGCGG